MTIIDTPDANRERIAFRSTQGEGMFKKTRWAELTVWYLHQPGPGGQRFVAETVGKSTHDGESDRFIAKASHKLEDALEHFKHGANWSAPARSVVEQARAWAKRFPDLAAGDYPTGPVYSDVQRERAAGMLAQAQRNGHTVEEVVDLVAEALGLRRAQA